jgi:DNA (cytosine-5)-methyltransferase 1
LFARHPDEANRAKAEALHAELGAKRRGAIDEHIRRQVGGAAECVLVGGPPCQAYSVVGRSRNKGNARYTPAADERQYLYRDYLKVLADHWPVVFVMENVRGLLSATLLGDSVFDRVLDDLRSPARAFKRREAVGAQHSYNVVALSPDGLFGTSVQEYVVKSEQHGIPQARHRVILLGIRGDLRIGELLAEERLMPRDEVPAREVLAGLPKLRSGLSRGTDSKAAWLDVFRRQENSRFITAVRRAAGSDVAEAVAETVAGMTSS